MLVKDTDTSSIQSLKMGEICQVKVKYRKDTCTPNCRKEINASLQLLNSLRRVVTIAGGGHFYARSCLFALSDAAWRGEQ